MNLIWFCFEVGAAIAIVAVIVRVVRFFRGREDSRHEC